MSSRAHAEIVICTSLQGLACVSPDWMSNCQYNGTAIIHVSDTNKILQLIIASVSNPPPTPPQHCHTLQHK